MSAMDAFYSTWSQARETFGSGVPADGSGYDNSNQLRQLQSSIESAKPDDRWQGPAADAYAAKNQQHAATYGKLADLDQRMAAEVGKTSGIVTAGRHSLDQLRDWATSAAASAPNDKSGENIKLAIASKGIGQISEIVKQSNDQMVAIGERIRGIGKEYDEIGGDKGKEKPDPDGPLTFAGGGRRGRKQKAQLDLDDIQRRNPGAPGPQGYQELVKGSGVWVPDPKSPYYKPHPPKHPLDLTQLQDRGRGSRGVPGEMELIPGSGVWVPDPNYPGFEQKPPLFPLDLDKVVDRGPNALGKPGELEIGGRGSGVFAPDPWQKLPPGTQVPQ